MTSTQLLPVPVRAPQQSSGPGISANRLLASTRHNAGSRLAQTKGAAFAAHPAARQGGLAGSIGSTILAILEVQELLLGCRSSGTLKWRPEVWGGRGPQKSGSPEEGSIWLFP